MGTKGREIFFFDVERREWDRDEQYIQSTYGSETKCERRRMGAKATRGSIKNEANPHSSPLRLCPLESFAGWNAIYKAIFGDILLW